MLSREAELIAKQCTQLAEYLERFDDMSDASDSARVAAEIMLDVARIMSRPEEEH